METKKNIPEMVSISRAEYEKFQAQGARISALKKQLDQLMEALRLSRKKQYGSSSEKEATAVAAHTRQKRSSRLEEVLPEGVPVEVVEHRMSAEQLECPVVGNHGGGWESGTHRE